MVNIKTKWNESARSFLVVIASAMTLFLSSLVWNTIQGHATEADLENLKVASESEDDKITRELHDHLGKARDEWTAQAVFRGQLRERLQLVEPTEDTRR